MTFNPLKKRKIGKIRKQLANKLEEFFDNVQPDDLVPIEGRHRNKTAFNGYGLGHRWGASLTQSEEIRIGDKVETIETTVRVMSLYTMTQLVKAKELDIEWDREIYGFDVFPKKD